MHVHNSMHVNNSFISIIYTSRTVSKTSTTTIHTGSGTNAANYCTGTLAEIQLYLIVHTASVVNIQFHGNEDY